MDIFLGAMFLAIFQLIITIFMFNLYFENINIKKYSEIKCMITLLIPIYGLFTIGIIPIILKNHITNNMKLIDVVTGIMFVILILFAILNKIKKSDNTAKLLGIYSLFFFPMLSMWLNKDRNYLEIYSESFDKLIQSYNIIIVIIALSIMFTFYKKIIELYRGEKNNFNLRIFSKYVCVYIVSFAILYFIFMVIDLTNVYANIQIYGEEKLKYLNLAYNFSNTPTTFNLYTLIQTIVNPIYFSIITFSTIGFGDIVPTLLSSKIVVIFEIIGMFYIMYIGLNIVLSKDDTKSDNEKHQ